MLLNLKNRICTRGTSRSLVFINEAKKKNVILVY